MPSKVWCNNEIQSKGLTLLSTASLRLLLCNTTPATKGLATSTANCVGFASTANTEVVAIAESSDWKANAHGRMVWIKKTTDILGRKCGAGAKATTDRVVKTVALINASTLLFVTKCSSRSYSTSGPDKINASSWAIIFYDPTTAT